MKILQQARTNVNYIAYVFDCNDLKHSHNHFRLSKTFLLTIDPKVTFSMKWLRLFTLSIRTEVMMVNIRTRVATVNLAFSISRNAAFISNVRTKLQYTALSMKIHQITLKIPKFLHYQTT